MPPAPGMIPSRISGWPILALSAANRKSQAIASSHPPPSAYPVTAAMVGTGMRATRSSDRCRAGPTRLTTSWWVRSGNSFMSAPAANTFGPPYTTTAPMSSRAVTSAAHSSISAHTWVDSAFMGGRSIRMVPTRVSLSTSRRTSSPTGKALRRVPAERAV